MFVLPYITDTIT